MTFARRVLRGAGIYGLLALLPMYFLEQRQGHDFPPPITHPEFYYGFVGVAVAWQVAFLIMSTDPVRYRPLLLAGVLEKSSYGLATIALFALGRVHALVLGTGLIDLVLGALFVAAYRASAPMPGVEGSGHAHAP